MLIKIGHAANKQSERIEMEVSTVGGGGVGLTDVSVCLSFLTCWEIKGTVERKKKKEFCSLLAIMQRSVAIFDT